MRTRVGAVITIEIAAGVGNGSMDLQLTGRNDVPDHTGGAVVVFTVQGDASHAEREVLTDLLQQIDLVTDQYFSTQIQDSLRKALSLGFDGRQLACYSLGVPGDANTLAPPIGQFRAGEPPSAWSVTGAGAQGGGPEARLGDAIKYVCRLGEIMSHEPGKMVFDRAGWMIGQLLKETVYRKAELRQEGEMLAHLADDIFNTLIMMHDEQAGSSSRQ